MNYLALKGKVSLHGNSHGKADDRYINITIHIPYASEDGAGEKHGRETDAHTKTPETVHRG
jgi:hypothetical protein